MLHQANEKAERPRSSNADSGFIKGVALRGGGKPVRKGA